MGRDGAVILALGKTNLQTALQSYATVFLPSHCSGAECHAVLLSAAVVAVLVPWKQCHMTQLEHLSKCGRQVATASADYRKAVFRPRQTQRSEILGWGMAPV